MIRLPSHHPARRVAAGARALGQGLLGAALIALAAFAFLPRADAAQAGHRAVDATTKAAS